MRKYCPRCHTLFDISIRSSHSYDGGFVFKSYLRMYVCLDCGTWEPVGEEGVRYHIIRMLALHQMGLKTQEILHSEAYKECNRVFALHRLSFPERIRIIQSYAENLVETLR